MNNEDEEMDLWAEYEREERKKAAASSFALSDGLSAELPASECPPTCEDCHFCQTINDDRTMYCHKKKREVWETCIDFKEG